MGQTLLTILKENLWQLNADAGDIYRIDFFTCLPIFLEADGFQHPNTGQAWQESWKDLV